MTATRCPPIRTRWIQGRRADGVPRGGRGEAISVVAASPLARGRQTRNAMRDEGRRCVQPDENVPMQNVLEAVRLCGVKWTSNKDRDLIGTNSNWESPSETSDEHTLALCYGIDWQAARHENEAGDKGGDGLRCGVG